MRRRNFVAFGLCTAMLIAVLAPFLASRNPDGLESAAGRFESAEGKGYIAFDSPFPDYAVPFLGEGGISEVAAILFGTLVIFVLSYAFTRAIKKAGA